MNAANLLTLVRFLLIPVYIGLFFFEAYWLAIMTIALSVLTDMADGYVARKYGLITYVGSMLDPLADKCMMLAIVFTLFMGEFIPWQAAAAFFIRDAGMIVGSLLLHVQGKRMAAANQLGKATTVLLYTAIVLILIQPLWGVIVLWAAIGLSFFASYRYWNQVQQMNRTQTEKHSP
ncbi:CDP-alcohol phosphatidyltransferase family protein [Marinicrinis sediminis]|uniref:CDP-diacylglycerol--glycerol-3-phosphate 3-phosphatidyltransferase n=1 Tax=Marinicrinis sediminis TaxID=1652465 RepID=A0ABW5RAS2_9BACL